MNYRVAVIHQGFIPIYRRGFFELLNSRPGREYVAIHGDPLQGSGHVALPTPYAFPNLRVRNRELRVGHRAVVYQPMVREVLRGGYDAIVIGHEIKFLSSMLLFALFKLRRRPVVLWGHGYHRASASPLARWTSGALARAADGYLAYTELSAARLRASGVPDDRITVVRNTIDMTDQERARQACRGIDPAILRAALGLRAEARLLLCVGRLEARKKIDEVIAAVAKLDTPSQPVDLVIVGDGPARTGLEQKAAGMPMVHFIGQTHETALLAKYFRAATAVVIPGAVGLAVNHAFAHGVPIVTRPNDLHGPEIEYVRHGVNGLIVPGDFQSFVDALDRLLSDAALQRQLVEGALATRDEISMEKSAADFDRGVRKAIERRRRGSRDRPAA